CSFFFSSRRRHTRFSRDWSSDVCSSDLTDRSRAAALPGLGRSAGAAHRGDRGRVEAGGQGAADGRRGTPAAAAGRAAAVGGNRFGAPEGGAPAGADPPIAGFRPARGAGFFDPSGGTRVTPCSRGARFLAEVGNCPFARKVVLVISEVGIPTVPGCRVRSRCRVRRIAGHSGVLVFPRPSGNRWGVTLRPTGGKLIGGFGGTRCTSSRPAPVTATSRSTSRGRSTPPRPTTTWTATASTRPPW